MRPIFYSNPQYLMLPVWHAYIRQHHGRLLKFLQKLYEEKMQREVLDEILAVADANKWTHVCSMLGRVAVSANPHSFTNF